jgi:hypothetical protein
MPRWSVAVHPVFVPLSIATLVLGSARVLVGPPLSASAPRSGSMSIQSPSASSGFESSEFRPHVFASSRLLPCDVTPTRQFGV